MLNLARRLEELDRYAAVGGVALGAALVLALAILAPDYIGLGAVLLLACGVYLCIRNRHSWQLHLPVLDSPTVRTLANVLFFGLAAVSLLLLHGSTYDRPPFYFVATALMAAVVAVDIFATPEATTGRTAFLLGKILLIAVSLRWSLYYMYPGSFLGVDPWQTTRFVGSIAESGHLVRDVGAYYYMPVQHVAVLSTSLLTGLEYVDSLLLSVGAYNIIGVLFAFVLASSLANRRVGLVTALVLAVNDMHIRAGWWLTSQTVGIALVGLLLLLLLRPPKGETVSLSVLSLLVMAVLILTHHVSAAVFLIILATLYCGRLLLNRWRPTNEVQLSMIASTTVLVFGVALAGYVLYVSRFLNYFSYVAVGSGEMTSFAQIPTSAATADQLWQQVNKLGPMLLYALSIVGILSVLKSGNRNPLTFAVVVCAACLTAILFVNLVVPLPTVLYVDRWFHFAQLVLCIPAALGLVSICSAVKRSRTAITILSTAVFLLSFFMAINTTASFDSPFLPDQMVLRRALKQSEWSAANTVASVHTGNLVLDDYYKRTFPKQEDIRTKALSDQHIQTGFADASGLLLLRTSPEADSILMARGAGNYYLYARDEVQASLDQSRLSRVYDCGTVSGYVDGSKE